MSRYILFIATNHEMDILDLMLQSRNSARQDETGVQKFSFSDEDIVDDIMLFMVAGQETASNVLCWTMYELSKNPRIQQECREEVCEEIRAHGELSYESLSRSDTDCDTIRERVNSIGSCLLLVYITWAVDNSQLS